MKTTVRQGGENSLRRAVGEFVGRTVLWLDVTGFVPGAYGLRITLNKDNLRFEGNYGNNTYVVPVNLP